MKMPSHTTVVAYLALFAVVGGTAIAARNDTGAKELKRPVVRERSTTADVGGAQSQVVVGCRREEQLLSGAAGWEHAPGSGTPAPTVRSVELGRGGVTAIGSAEGQSNTLTAQAVCLPR